MAIGLFGVGLTGGGSGTGVKLSVSSAVNEAEGMLLAVEDSSEVVVMWAVLKDTSPGYIEPSSQLMLPAVVENTHWFPGVEGKPFQGPGPVLRGIHTGQGASTEPDPTFITALLGSHPSPLLWLFPGVIRDSRRERRRRREIAENRPITRRWKPGRSDTRPDLRSLS